MTMPKEAKERFCFNCGASMGCYADYDPLDDCGSAECTREVREIHQAEREEAHEQLDRDRGW
jgi:hypothetical protein